MNRPLQIGMAALLGFIAGVPARGQAWSVEEVYEAGSVLLQDYVPDDMREVVNEQAAAEWSNFWQSARTALDSQSLEDLDWVLPYAEGALEWLKSTEDGAQYAAWLEQRVDYFDMARNVIQLFPAPGASSTRAASKPPRIVPPRRPASAPVPAAINAQRLNHVRKEAVWREKLAARPIPPNAAGLLPGLKKAFKDEGVPPEWVWIAEVESTFNPRARSPVGAAGLFQFMPATAQRFGLRTALPDERKIPAKSATAAAKYLKVLYRQFKSWPLCLAAYNAGEGRVARLLKKSGGTTFAEIEDGLPIETQMYVPKVLATVELRESVDPRALPAPVARRWVLPGYLAARSFAQ